MSADFSVPFFCITLIRFLITSEELYLFLNKPAGAELSKLLYTESCRRLKSEFF